MIASAHIAAGAVVGMLGARLTRNRLVRLVVAVALGLFSHFLLDEVPHSDYLPLSQAGGVRMALLEVVGMSFIVWRIVRRRLPPGSPDYLFLGIGAACIADAKSVATLFLTPGAAAVIRDYGYRIHEGRHAAPPATLLAGWGAEIATTVVLLGVLLLISPRTRTEEAA